MYASPTIDCRSKRQKRAQDPVKMQERALSQQGDAKQFVRHACEALAFAPEGFADQLAARILDSLQPLSVVPPSLVAPLLLSGHPRLVARALRADRLGPMPNADRDAWDAFLASLLPYSARPSTPPLVLEVRQWTLLMRRHGPGTALRALATPHISGRHALQAALAVGTLETGDAPTQQDWRDLFDLAVAKDEKRQRVLLDPTTRALVLLHAEPGVAAYVLRSVVASYGRAQGTIEAVAKQMAQANDACGVYAFHLAGIAFPSMRPYAVPGKVPMPTALFFDERPTGHAKLHQIALLQRLPQTLEGFLGNKAAQHDLQNTR